MKTTKSLYFNASQYPIAYVVSHREFGNLGYVHNRNGTLELQHLSETTKVTIRFISFELGNNSTCQNKSTRDVLSIHSDNNTVPIFKCGDTNAIPQPLVFNNPNFDSLRLNFVSATRRTYAGFLLQYLGQFSMNVCSFDIFN